ncbi:flagellar hook capping protein [Microbacterium aerolatum]|uniref:flagellar hook assembly protein FlgD n=1 Tax=Microbacterium aerolatum TaxID=153731 RepID=UPI00384BF154
MTTVDAISAASAVATSGLQTGSTTPATERKQTLDSEVFLKLLVTQLTNQDPSSPMNTNEMIAQTTQLASMEQLTALSTTTNENFALSMRQTAATLIGQEAQYVDADGVEQTGIVSAVSFSSAVPMVTIGDTAVPLDAVSGLTLVSQTTRS